MSLYDIQKKIQKRTLKDMRGNICIEHCSDLDDVNKLIKKVELRFFQLKKKVVKNSELHNLNNNSLAEQMIIRNLIKELRFVLGKKK